MNNNGDEKQNEETKNEESTSEAVGVIRLEDILVTGRPIKNYAARMH
jgi:hypothetical protein